MRFEVEEDENECADLSDEEIEAIKAGMEDFNNGHVVSHAEAMAQIEDHIKNRKINPHI